MRLNHAMPYYRIDGGIPKMKFSFQILKMERLRQRKAIQKSRAAVPRRLRTESAKPGLTPAASTTTVALSFRKSALCIPTMHQLAYAMHIWKTSRVAKIPMRRIRALERVFGLPEDGHCKNSLHPRPLYSLPKTGSRLAQRPAWQILWKVSLVLNANTSWELRHSQSAFRKGCHGLPGERLREQKTERIVSWGFSMSSCL